MEASGQLDAQDLFTTATSGNDLLDENLLYYISIVASDKIEKNEMGWACGTYG